jgi:hypothetical protein
MTVAKQLTADLGGHWCGRYGKARCPVHTDSEPSLSIRSGGPDGIRVKCFRVSIGRHYYRAAEPRRLEAFAGGRPPVCSRADKT